MEIIAFVLGFALGRVFGVFLTAALLFLYVKYSP
jgi:hypothetical protein